MSTAQVTLRQVLKALTTSLRSVDIRVAALKLGEGWQTLLACIRLSERDVALVAKRHSALEKQFGGRPKGPIRIMWEAQSTDSLESILTHLDRGTLSVEGRSVRLSGRPPLDSLPARIRRQNDFLRPSSDAPSSAVTYYAGDKPVGSNDPGIMAAVQAHSGFGNLWEIVDAFLEVKESGQRTSDLLMNIEIPARIRSASIRNGRAEIEILVERNLKDPHLFLMRRSPNGSELLERHQLILCPLGEEAGLASFRSSKQLQMVQRDENLQILLTGADLPVLDEISNFVWRFLPPWEGNPLLECFKAFVAPDAFASALLRPHESSEPRTTLGPQDHFQKAVARLVSLGGFQTIDLGRQDVIRDPNTRVERATLDILAYHPDQKLLLLAACTLGQAKGEDVNKVLHARSVLANTLTQESPIRLIAALFTGQEGDPADFSPEARRRVVIIGKRTLAALYEELKAGCTGRFVSLLTEHL